jgi:biopolymer transport protein ExbD
MIATPIFVTQAVPVNLPKSAKGIKVSPQNETFVTVSMQDGKNVQYYFLQDKNPQTLADIDRLLGKKINPSKKETVYIYSDGKAPMESIVNLSDIISRKGGKVYIITKNN